MRAWSRICSVVLALVIVAASLPLTSSVASALDKSCLASGFAVTLDQNSSNVIDVCVTNVSTPAADGTVSADFSITNKKAITYTLAFDRSGSVTAILKTNGKDLFEIVKASGAKFNKSTAFFPLIGNSTLPLRASFSAGSRLAVRISKFGQGGEYALETVTIGFATLFSKVYGGLDVGKAVSSDPDVGIDFAAGLGASLKNVGFDLAGFTGKLYTGDWLGALEALAKAMESAPDVFANFLGLSSEFVKDAAGKVGGLLKAIDAVPFLYDLATAPTDASFSLTDIRSNSPIVLPPGSTSSIVKTIFTPTIPTKPDVVFLADTTGSMGGAIASVQAKAADVMNQVQKVQPDARFGVAEYKDFNCDVRPYGLNQAITSTLTDVQSAIDSWSASGGCDTPESQLNALYQLATDPTTGWRGDSSRIVAWFGDYNGHDPSNGHTLQQTIDALKAAGIKVIAVDIGYLDQCADGGGCGQATAITSATGGKLLKLNSGSSPSAMARASAAGTNNAPVLVPQSLTASTDAVADPTGNDVADAILAGLTSLPVTIAPQISSPSPYVTITFDPISQTVTSGESATFEVSITVDKDLPPGTPVSVKVDFLLDGKVVDDPAVTSPIVIAVPKDTTPPVTTASTDPTQNSTGWSNRDVIVTLAATDDSSGAIETEFKLDSGGWTAYASPLVITTEGEHTLLYRSTDAAGNQEVDHSLTVKLDKTTPEASLQFDRVAKDVVIAGKDSLSGVPSGAIRPSSIVASTWAKEDDDAVKEAETSEYQAVAKQLGGQPTGAIKAELRAYKLSDAAGNTLEVRVKARKVGNSIRARIVSLSYQGGLAMTPARNGSSFLWLANKDGSLKALAQATGVVDGTGRHVAIASFDASKNQSVIITLDWTKSWPVVKMVKRSGLVLLQLLTNKGKLSIGF